MSQSVRTPRMSAGCAAIAAGLLLGWNVTSQQAHGQDAAGQDTTTQPSLTDELLKSTTPTDRLETSPAAPTSVDIDTLGTPSFEELDSAASDLNEALSGARAKLDELRQATELAAMAAELREELESSIQENNRLAASLAEVQTERSDLEAQNSEAQRRISELTEMVERSRMEIAEQTDQLQRRQDQIDQTAAARDAADEQVRALERELATADQEVDQLSDEIIRLSGDLEVTRTELADANAEVEAEREARSDADRELSTVKKQIAGMLRSVLLGGEPVDVSQLEDEGIDEDNNFGLGTRYEAIRASNVRAEPDPASARVGFAKRGDAITVLNKVNGRNWFEIETLDGVRGFIFGDLIRPSA